MLMPFQVTLVPNYIMADKLGLLNSPYAIILPGIFAAFGVFMLQAVHAGYSVCLYRSGQNGRSRTFANFPHDYRSDDQTGLWPRS